MASNELFLSVMVFIGNATTLVICDRDEIDCVFDQLRAEELGLT